MKDGFIRVAAATPEIKIADCVFNSDTVIAMIKEADSKGASVIVFPELCLTGASCGDLFFQKKLIDSAFSALEKIASDTKKTDVTSIIGFPFKFDSKLYNCAAAVYKGKIISIIPKTYFSGEQKRYFSSAENLHEPVLINNGQDKILFGKIVLGCKNIHELKIGVEIGSEAFSQYSPSEAMSFSGVSLVCNPCSFAQTTGISEKRRNNIINLTSKLMCGYISSNAGKGETSTDRIYAGQNFIAENGVILNQSNLFTHGIIYSEIDIQKLDSERLKNTMFQTKDDTGYAVRYKLDIPIKELKLERKIIQTPFIPDDKNAFDKQCEETVSMQAYGLAKRLEHTKCGCSVIGLSGGLDSTLALIATVKAYDILGLSRKNIIAVTMPCFGTTKRTKNNAQKLSEAYETGFLEINIKNSVLSHFGDIGQDPDNCDVVFENAQARERTQVLMDIANQNNGMVIGTGDMSELALGWATYNGDHMSMYAVNSGIPKTSVRYLVKYTASHSEEPLKSVLFDILDTPVSPELLPPSEGEISQITEELVGPYELHDFFLYYFLKYGFTPEKIYRLAVYAFKDSYSEDIIKKWLNTFTRRFFSQQFKRSCMPDGVNIESIGLSPRCGLKMPSDAVSSLWNID